MGSLDALGDVASTGAEIGRGWKDLPRKVLSLNTAAAVAAVAASS